MSILHFIETDIPGGAEQMLLELCILQKDAGLNPKVAHFDHPYLTRQFNDVGIPSIPLPNRTKFKSRYSLLAFSYEFATQLRRENVRLLHCHLFGPIIAGTISARIAGIPCVGTLHDIHMVQEATSRIWQLRLALLMGAHLVAVSKNMQDYYIKEAKILSSNIHLIHNGIHIEGNVAGSQYVGATKSNDNLNLITVGRLVDLKRVADAIAAFGKVSKHVSARLLIVGSGPMRSELEELVHQLGLCDKIQFLGHREDVADLLAISDIYVQCSSTEGLSMAILEAMRAALPCVVTNVGGNPELIENSNNGFLVNVGDVGSIADKIALLIEDSALRRKMGAKSREIIESRFSAKSCAESYTALYQTLLKN